jgi:nucleoredoxin
MSLSIDNEFTSGIAQDFSDLQDKLKKSAKETVNESMQTIGKELKSSITDIFKVAAGSTPKNSSQANASTASASTGFAGDWNTSFGKMKLEVNGDSVRGTYQMGQELCQLEGKITGPEMVFNYTERSATGKGKFTLAPDGMSFSGQWLEDGSNQWKPWQGRRPSEAAIKPWSKLEELVGTELMDANGNKVDVKSLQGKIIGLYFLAHWCGPCRQFTPKLVEFRNANTKDFEVIFVSSDRSAADQQKYMQESGMNWPAVPYQSEWKAILKERFSIRGIPALIIVDGKGNLISAQGRSEVDANSTTTLAKWKNLSPNR